MLFFINVIVTLCGLKSVMEAQDHPQKASYEDEAMSRKAEALRLQKTGEEEMKDKALKAQKILQHHLKNHEKGEESGSRGSVCSQKENQGCQVLSYTHDLKSHPSTPRPHKNQVIVFVSFSMPQISLKALFEAVDTNQEVKLVMRGFLEDSMEKTVRKLHDLGGVLDIDPDLFEQFQITQVPTFVMVKKDQSVLKLAGNITLQHAKEIFKSQLLKDHLDQEQPS